MQALRQGEQGFLLLTSQLGDPARKPLSVAQFRELTSRAGNPITDDPDRDVTASDFVAMGYSRAFGERIVSLLSDTALLRWYLGRAEKHRCVPVTRATERYPLIVRKRLGMDSPGVLWAKGDVSLLGCPGISLVGSRELSPRNREFAEEVGRRAAVQGLVLVSGNARGADKAAQNACLKAGGKVISVVADSLLRHASRENVLYLSENGFDEEFSPARALSRNRVIHSLGRITFAAQATLEKGGTWDGTVKNLRHNWSPVVCFRDGSEASIRLEQMGAYLIDLEEVGEYLSFPPEEPNLFDR